MPDLTIDQVDGFVGSALLPDGREAIALQDGVSTVSPNWLARAIGVEPSLRRGIRRYGSDSGQRRARRERDRRPVRRTIWCSTVRFTTRLVATTATTWRRIGGDMQWTAPQGYFGPLAMIALPTNEYLHRYGASREALAEIAVEARKNGARIPWSFWHDKPLTDAEYLESPTLVRSDLSLRLRHPRRRRRRLRVDVG